MLSWRQAWLKLAKAFETATRNADGDFRADIKGYNYHGVCSAIGWLYSEERITEKTRAAMRAVVPKRGGRGWGRLFAWSTDSHAGRRARVRFCRKMAETKRPK